MQRISLITTLFLSFASCAGASEGPLLINESFEQSNTLPSDWQFEHWLPDVSAAEIQSQTAADGKHSLHLSSTQANHAYVKKTIAVQANQTYLFQAKIKAIGADAGKLAAVIGIDGNADASEAVYDNQAWQTRQLYIKSGDATSLTVLLGLGHYANNNLGDAWFDDVSVRQVDLIPAGAKVLELSPPAAAAEPPSQHRPDTSPWLILSASLLALAVLSVALAHWLKRKTAQQSRHE